MPRPRIRSLSGFLKLYRMIAKLTDYGWRQAARLVRENDPAVGDLSDVLQSIAELRSHARRLQQQIERAIANRNESK